MSIKTQKIIRFIPIINMITAFLWMGMCLKNSITVWDFLKPLLKIFALIILITIPRIVVAFVLENQAIDTVLMWIATYLYFFVLSWVSVAEQLKILEKSSNN